MNKQEERRELIKYGLEEYESAFIEGMGEFIEGGQVIGVEAVSKRELRAFFDSVEPMAWLSATIEDPEGALSMLSEYIESEASV